MKGPCISSQALHNPSALSEKSSSHISKLKHRPILKKNKKNSRDQKQRGYEGNKMVRKIEIYSEKYTEMQRESEKMEMQRGRRQKNERFPPKEQG